MIEITHGLILTGISILGLLCCVAALIVTAVIFPKQRKRLLAKLEQEQCYGLEGILNAMQEMWKRK